MSKLHHARPLRAGPSSLFASLGLVALLAACGSQPEPANNAVAVPDNVINETVNAAENAVVNETAPANVTNTAEAAPKPMETPVAMAAAAAAPTPAAKPAEAASSGDAANGAKLFAQCKICHSVDADKNGLGPSLHGVVGRKAATLAGFNYSPAMKGSGLTWSDAELNDYLRAPMKAVPGTKMAFAGIANDKNRADVIAYLDTLK
jgi:cytochrome c2